MGTPDFVRRALAPLRRLLARSGQAHDPWERLPYASTPRGFARGSTHPFPWYFEGESRVVVTCIDDICDWLLACEYVQDVELFHESDFWQHPSTFERLRQGDCEDYALWAWRKLVELGIDAELVAGVWHPPHDAAGEHVWIRYVHDDTEFILEAVSRTRERMVRTLDSAKAEYVPHAGVDRRFQLHAYSGYLHSPG
ncbi:MAG: hypothetical protein ABI664_20910 [bacterium]